MSLWDDFLKDIATELKNEKNFLKQKTIRRCLHPGMDTVTAMFFKTGLSPCAMQH